MSIQTWIAALKGSIMLSDAQCVERSGLFDAVYYLKKNPDLNIPNFDLLEHYIKYGGFEDRAPSTKFDSKWYLSQNPDVAWSGINPLVHYIRHGKKQGRSPLPPSLISSEERNTRIHKMIWVKVVVLALAAAASFCFLRTDFSVTIAQLSAFIVFLIGMVILLSYELSQVQTVVGLLSQHQETVLQRTEKIPASFVALENLALAQAHNLHSTDRMGELLKILIEHMEEDAVNKKS